MNKKFILAALATFVAYFLGGFLMYGLLLKNAMASNTPEAAKALMMDPPNWTPLIIGNLCIAVMITWVLDRTNSNSVIKGIITTVTLNLLISLGYSLIWTSMMAMYVNNTTGILIELGATIGTSVLSGAAGGAVLGSGSKAS